MLFLLIYITTPCTVVGQSMENTFYDGDKLFCVDVFYTPKEGDVVVFDAEHYANEDAFFIKRVEPVTATVPIPNLRIIWALLTKTAFRSSAETL